MLKKAIIGTVIFAGGAVTGFIACDILRKEQYKEEASIKAREEINEVKDIYKQKLEEFEKTHTERLDKFEAEQLEKYDKLKESAESKVYQLYSEKDKREVIEYDKLAGQYKSTKYPTQKEEPEEIVEDEEETDNHSISELNMTTYEKTIYNRPEIIDPDEFGELEDYDTMQLTYFMGDKKLVDEDADDVIDEPDLHIGEDILKRFEEFPEATSLYVRNETLKMDFEILRDDFSYEDITEKTYPEQREKKPHEL